MDCERDTASADIPRLSQSYAALALVFASHPGAARRDQRSAFLLVITLALISLTLGGVPPLLPRGTSRARHRWR